jgi:hypothetical protein
MRLAARPVGAHSSSLTPLAARMRRMPFTMVVLPTPGPPVMTSTLETSASLIAAVWVSARASPIRPPTHGNALSGSIQGHGSVPFNSRISRSAMARSARCSPARNVQRVSPTLSAMTVPSAGRPHYRCLGRAEDRARDHGLPSQPRRRYGPRGASVLNPIPRMSRARRYGFSDMACTASDCWPAAPMPAPGRTTSASPIISAHPT